MMENGHTRSRYNTLLFTLLITAVRAFHITKRRVNCIHPSKLNATPSTETPSLRSYVSGRRRVVVIGAGVGGLASAARIATETSKWEDTVEIVVIEKNGRDMMGGRCGSFFVDIEGVGTFRHERGPSLLLLKDEYERLFAHCSVNNDDPTTAAEKYGLFTKQCVPAYQVVFDDGDTVNLGFPRSKRDSLSVDDEIQELEQRSIQQLNSFEPDGFEKWKDYLETCASFLDCGLPNFIEERLDLGTLPKFMIESLKENAIRWPLQPHSRMLANLFQSPKLIALASFQDLYVGLEPYTNEKQLGGGVLRKTAPAVFGLLAALELHPANKKCGVYAPVGGFRQVAESMYNLCKENGVKFEFDASVTSVEDTGVYIKTKMDDELSFLSADLVICNADLPFATQTIASNDWSREIEERYDWDDKFDYSSGVVAFHWSVDRKLDSLNTHNVFMSAKSSDDAQKSWNVLRDENKQQTRDFSACQPFNFYIHRASKTDPTAAPAGCDSIMVLVPCVPLKRDEMIATLPRDLAISKYKQQFDDKVVSSVRDAVFERMSVLEELKDLKDCIINEIVDTPATYADYYNVGAGVPFGLSHGLGQLSLTRPGADCSSRENVMFVGASSRPGNGVPLVMIGAKSVASKAVQRFRAEECNSN